MAKLVALHYTKVQRATLLLKRHDINTLTSIRELCLKIEQYVNSKSSNSTESRVVSLKDASLHLGMGWGEHHFLHGRLCSMNKSNHQQ